MADDPGGAPGGHGRRDRRARWPSAPAARSAARPTTPRRPARTPGAPDAEAERAALKAVDDAKATEHLRDVEVRDLEARLARLQEIVGGGDAATLIEERDALAAETARLTSLADGADALARSLAEAEQAARADAEAAQRLRQGRGARRRDRDGARRARAPRRARWQRSSATPDTTASRTCSQSTSGSPPGGREALQGPRRPGGGRAQPQRGRDGARRGRDARPGSATPGRPIEAILGADEILVLTETTEAHERRLATLEAVLAEPGADDDSPLPRLEELEVAHADALAGSATPSHSPPSRPPASAGLRQLSRRARRGRSTAGALAATTST